jgi:hypothetical protein
MPITPAAAPETAVGIAAPAADVALEMKPEASVATLLAPKIPVLIPISNP